MMTTKTTIQTEISITTAKAAAMPTKTVTVIDVTIIMTREAKEATVVMTDKKEIVIMLVTNVSHIMWRKSAIALAPALRVVAAVAVALQATAALVLVLCQMTAREVMKITMWRAPTWIWMKERYLHLVTLIQPNSVEY
eukprot:12329514-Ditylum_brightwellii.AAC.1